MGNFTKSVTNTYSFDGDQIQVTFRRLKRHEALQLTPYFSQEDGDTTMTFKDQMEMSSAVCDLFPDIILSLSGLYIDGKEVVYKKGDKDTDFDEFVSNAYFLTVHTELMTDILNDSFVKESEEKKSEALPKNTLRATGPQVSAMSSSVG